MIAYVLTTLAWWKPLQVEMHAKLNTQTFIPPDNSSTSQDTICPETNINSHKCQPRLKKINKYLNESIFPSQQIAKSNLWRTEAERLYCHRTERKTFPYSSGGSQISMLNSICVRWNRSTYFTTSHMGKHKNCYKGRFAIAARTLTWSL